MQFGKLTFEPVEDNVSLVAKPVGEAVSRLGLSDVLVSAIDPNLADTAAFCEQYGVGLDVSANCVIIQAKRADKAWFVACMILATERIDVNNVVRRHLDARKISFAPMEQAVSLSGMEYGGITPIGLPTDWMVLVDEAVARSQHVIIGSGIRGSKLLVGGAIFSSLPNATIMRIAKDS